MPAVGLALVNGEGEALVGVMGVPPEEEAPPIMAAVAGHGLRWFNAVGAAPVAYDPPKPAWADKPLSDGPPPWLISPQKAAEACTPFGPDAQPSVVCCGAMIKYFQVRGAHAPLTSTPPPLRPYASSSSHAYSPATLTNPIPKMPRRIQTKPDRARGAGSHSFTLSVCASGRGGPLRRLHPVRGGAQGMGSRMRAHLH